MIDRQPPVPSHVWHDGPDAHRQPESAPGRSRKTRTRQIRPQPRRRWLAVLGYGALALACLGAAAVAFLLVAAPVDLVRDRIIDQVKARTGRDLTVAGPTSLSFFPHLAVALSDVSLSPPGGIEAPPMLVVPTVEAEIRLWSLLTAQPAVERITLHRPTIELSVDAQGGRSWRSTGLRPQRSRSALPTTDPAHAQQPTGEPLPATEPRQTTVLSKFGAGSVRIIDGTVRYRDHGTGSRADIESLNVTLAAEGRDAPLKVNGTLAVRGAPLTIAGTVSPIHALLADQPAHLVFRVSGSPFEGTYEGTVTLAAGVLLDGRLKLQAASARTLGDWLGRPVPTSGDTDAVAFSTEVKTAQGRVSLSNLQASFGTATLAGSLALDTRQERRRLSGNLDISELDFGRLLVKPGLNRAAVPGPSTTSVASPPAATPHVAPPSSASPPDKQGRSRGWSDDPINLAVLGMLDANLTLSAGQLIYKDVKTGPSRLSVALEGGVAKVTLEDAELYGGRGQGVLTLDGTGDALVTGANLKLDGVAFQPLLADALQFPWLEGRGSISLALAGQGLSERQIVETLNGKVEIASADGAIVGLNIGKIVRNLQRARLPSFTPSPDEKTPFSELAGTFTVTNGVAKNQDLRLVSSHLQLNGEGTLDLGPRHIDYTVRTKVGGATDPDATLKVGTLEVPVTIVGPWEKPTFGIKGQEQLTGALKQIRKNLKSQDVRDAIKGLLQGDGEKRVKPRDLIEKLLKKD